MPPRPLRLYPLTAVVVTVGTIIAASLAFSVVSFVDKIPLGAHPASPPSTAHPMSSPMLPTCLHTAPSQRRASPLCSPSLSPIPVQTRHPSCALTPPVSDMVELVGLGVTGWLAYRWFTVGADRCAAHAPAPGPACGLCTALLPSCGPSTCARPRLTDPTMPPSPAPSRSDEVFIQIKEFVNKVGGEPHARVRRTQHPQRLSASWRQPAAHLTRARPTRPATQVYGKFK